MEARSPGPAGRGVWLSLTLHAIILSALLYASAEPPAEDRQDEGLPVEIWTPQDLEALTRRPDSSPVPVRAPSPPPADADQPAAASIPTAPPSTVPQAAPSMPDVSAPAPERPSPALRHAEKILSTRVLSDPRSREARALLPSLEENTRLEQICDIEAMAQIAAGKEYRPDRVVAYATADTKRQGRMILADGAAFRSNGLWYKLAFHCRVASGRAAVESFDLAVGRAIPKGLWEEFGLPAVY
jgi:hypothetical protein